MIAKSKFGVQLDVPCNIVAAHVMTCNECMKIVMKYATQKAGSTITNKKQKASRLNGLKGGRPRKVI